MQSASHSSTEKMPGLGSCKDCIECICQWFPIWAPRSHGVSAIQLQQGAPELYLQQAFSSTQWLLLLFRTYRHGYFSNVHSRHWNEQKISHAKAFYHHMPSRSSNTQHTTHFMWSLYLKRLEATSTQQN